MIFLDWRGFSVHLGKLGGGNVCLAVQKMASSFIIMGRAGITVQSPRHINHQPCCFAQPGWCLWA